MTQRVKLLLIEPCIEGVGCTGDLLAGARDPSVDLDWRRTFEDGLDALNRQQHQVYLFDQQLGSHTGLELLREAVRRGCKEPLILISQEGNRALHIEALKAGAVDCLPKDQINLALLERAIRHALERRRFEKVLRRTSKMETVGRMAGGMAQNLSALMTGVVGLSESLLTALPLDDPKRQALEKIKKAGEQASGLATNLLAFSRVEMLRPVIFSLNTLVTESSPLLRSILGEAIKLETSLEPTLYRIKADLEQLRQALLTLIMDAREALPHGGAVAIRTANFELQGTPTGSSREIAPGSYAALSITDRQDRAEAETNPTGNESPSPSRSLSSIAGLGLASVSNIAKQNGGTITVDSARDRGTTFTLYLPRHAEITETAPARLPLQSMPRGSETILVVDDEPSIRQLVRTLLVYSGYTVLEAPDGAEALKLSAQQTEKIHLLVTDVLMPGMNGCELAQQLIAKRPGLRVLFLTGHPGNAASLLAAGMGQTALLQKPFSTALLVRKVREILEGT